MDEKTLRKKYKIKGSRMWVSILIVFLLASLAVLLGYIVYNVFLGYVEDAKITEECRAVQRMAQLYDEGATLPEDQLYALLNSQGKEFFIRDKQGNVIYSNGENTCSETKASYRILAQKEKVTLYEDAKYDYVSVQEDNVKIHYADVIRLAFYSEGRSELIDEELLATFDHEIEIDEDAWSEDGSYIPEGELRLPFWTEMPVKNGELFLVARSYVHISVADLVLLVSLLVIIGFIGVLIFVLTIWFVISSIVKQKRTLRVFLTEPVTGDQNWSGFLFKSVHRLRKGSAKKVPYALVNLLFVNYRNYCMCHSVEEGNEMLRKISDIIKDNLQKKELIGHPSPAEFAMLMKYEDEDRLKMRVQALILKLEKIDMDHVFHFQAGVDLMPCELNKGGNPVRRKKVEVEEQYNNACTARLTLGDSMDSGVVIFGDKLVEDQRWMDRVQEKQWGALMNEEFQVYYQPKYNPDTKELKGAEALIRWQSPDLGFVSPGRFIPIFEKNGFITEIDHYMIKHVAHDQKRWLERGFKCVPVSVNVSRAHFIENDLAEQIRDMVDEAGTPHDLVEIELTESAFFDDKNAIIRTINKLKEYGFAVSMDDFGSGYSSLNSLKDMPLDVLKLDAEFFRGEEDERGEIVVTEAIQLAKRLKMRTVAEGVEEKKQVKFLAEQGCDMIQGFYFAKPMPKLDYEARMKAGKSLDTDDLENESEKPAEETKSEIVKPAEESKTETAKPAEESKSETAEAEEITVETAEPEEKKSEETAEIAEEKTEEPAESGEVATDPEI